MIAFNSIQLHLFFNHYNKSTTIEIMVAFSIAVCLFTQKKLQLDQFLDRNLDIFSFKTHTNTLSKTKNDQFKIYETIENYNICMKMKTKDKSTN